MAQFKFGDLRELARPVRVIDGDGVAFDGITTPVVPPVPPVDLLDCLTAYWPGNEASGNLLDAHTNGLDLADVNTVTSNTGHVYPTARQHTRANNEYHERTNEALLQGASYDYTFACWFRLDSIADQQTVAVEVDSVRNCWWLNFNTWYAGGLSLIVYNTAGATAQVQATNFGALSVDTWYSVVCWFSDGGDTMGIQVNDVAPNTAALAITPHVTNLVDTSFRIGHSAGRAFDGRIGPSAVWRSDHGGCGLLDATKRAVWYNGGSGEQYPF